MALTDIAIRNAKVPAGKKQIKKTDGEGLYLLVKENGAKLWQMAYRFAGVRRTLSFGPYPDVSLQDARAQRADARKLIRDGVDPAEKKKLDRLAEAIAQDNTFEFVADEYIKKLVAENKAEATIAKATWVLKDLCAPLAKRPISKIQSIEILDVLQKIEKSGRRESAHRTRGMVGSLYRFAIAKLWAESDPTYALKGSLLKVMRTPRPAITDPVKFGRLLAAIDEYDGWPTLVACMKIQSLCFARPYETRTMEWIELDLRRATWTIPAEKMKMRVEHQVPLSRQAVAVIEDIRMFSGNSRFVFPSIRDAERPISECGMNSMLRRMGVMSSEHCPHGFRSSASTMLNGTKKYDADWIEVQLSHLDEDEVRRAYNRAKYWNDRVAMMQDWADMCDQMKNPKPKAVYTADLDDLL